MVEKQRCYYFNLGNPIGIHYIVCIDYSDTEILFVLVTSQFQSKQAKFAKWNFDFRSLVPIELSKCSITQLTKPDSCIDCNNIYAYDKSKFTSSITSNCVLGLIDDLHYEQILIGIIHSTRVDKKYKVIAQNQYDALYK